MDVGRESVMLAIPFTAGVAAASYSLQIFHIDRFCLETVSCILLTLTCLAAVIIWKHRACIGWLPLSAVFLAAGAAVSLIHSIPYISGPDGSGFAIRCADRLKSLIDGIPFSSQGSNALVKAFLTGDQGSLDRNVRDAFRESGASHLLALSGMHLSIIYLVVSRILSVLGNAPAVRFARSAIIVGGAAFFTAMTGAVPSLVRAFFFILLRECATLTGRIAGNTNIFCIALLIQLALTPSVVTSIGFQLSYLAMSGIFLLYKPLDGLWEMYGDRATDNGTCEETGHRLTGTLMDSLRHIWSLCALSIACQVFTAPAVLLYFGTFPQYFLITNLLCIPLSNIIIVLSIIILPLYGAGICPQILIDADNLLLTALTDILGIISTM